jgi:PPOX class probable F420-dependent enzyme
MPNSIYDLTPTDLQHLLEDQTRAYAFLSTLMKNGSPQLTPIWFNVEDGMLTINSVKGRVKDQNLRRDPRLAIVIMDFSKPLEYIQVRGRVADITEEGGEEHIHALAQKYQGKNWNIPDGQIRVKYRIQVEAIS